MADLAVPILMYHEVSPDPDPGLRRYAHATRDFARQMRWLAEAGYETLDMDTLEAARRREAELPPRPVVLTFDDGFRDCARNAVPVLREHGFTAVFYLVAGCMGETSRWTVAEVGSQRPIMRWETAARLGEDGFQLGAHTVTHPRLTEVAADRCRAELMGARERIEAETGRAVRHLAYPFGAYDAAVRAMAGEAGYATACSTRPGLSGPGDDLLALRRVTVYGPDTLAVFAARVRTGAASRPGSGDGPGGLGGRIGRGLSRLARGLMGGREP